MREGEEGEGKPSEMSSPRSSSCAHEPLSPNVRRMYITLRAAAFLLFVPHALASMYVVATSPDASATTWLYVFAFSFVAIGATYYLAVYKQCGDYLLMSSWLFGLLSAEAWVYLSSDTVSVPQGTGAHFLSVSSALIRGGKVVHENGHTSIDDNDSRLLWVAASMLQGVIGGVLCKMKDIDEDRYYPTHAIGERLYVVVPFCTGQWLSFIIQNGWRGIIIENLTILLSLAMVGYCVIGYKLLQEHTSLKKGDLIGFVEELLTTSFGVVFTVIILGSVFVMLLAIPFLKSLFSLNALVSSVGILLEFIVYEVA